MEEPANIDLLRLRVLATRKKPKDSNQACLEEGEISEANNHRSPFDENSVLPLPVSFSDIPLRPVSLENSPALQERYFRQDNYLKSKRKKKRWPELAYDSLREHPSLTYPNESFCPQSLIVTIDSEIESADEQDPNIRPDKELPNLEKPSSFLNPVALGLLSKELEKQKQTFEKAKNELAMINQEQQSIEARNKECEEIIKSAVNKQQSLKAQLKATKELIMKNKSLKTKYLARKQIVEKDYKKLSKFLLALEESIAAKESRKDYLSLRKGNEEKQNGNTAIELQNLAVDETLDSDVNNSNGTTFSKRNSELMKLEKQALKVKESLMGAHISLLQKRASLPRMKSSISGKKKGGRPRAPILGKVLAMSPALLTDAKKTDLASIKIENEHLDASVYFPEFLYSIGDHLIPINIINGVRNLFKTFQNEFATCLHITEVEDDMANQSPTTLSKQPIALSLTYEPYVSPLRSFKDYRLSPWFPHVAPNQGILSRTYTNHIVSSQILCTDDLIYGKCTRKICKFQHFKTICLSGILPSYVSSTVLHIILDESLLEDLVWSLMQCRTNEPFKSDLDLLTYLKDNFIKRQDQSLFGLVGVVVEAAKLMNLSHYINFSSRQSKPIHDAIRKLFSRQENPSDIDQLPASFDTRRYFLSGVANLSEGVLPRLWRYFDVDRGYTECLERLNSNPKDVQSWIELSLLSMAKCRNTKDISTASIGLEILTKGAIENPNSDILYSLVSDMSTLCNSPISSLSGVLCPWIEFGRIERKLEPYINWMNEHLAQSPVDIILAFVKGSCDMGCGSDALSVLKIALTSSISEQEAKYDGFLKLLKDNKNCFSASDIAYLTMMYLYIRDFSAYPTGAYVGGPFDMLRRQDFYYLHPWANQTITQDEDYILLKHLYEALVLEDSKSPVTDWILCNLLNLSEKMGKSTDVLTMNTNPSYGSLSRFLLHLFNTKQSIGETVLPIVQSHPLVMLTFIFLISQVSDEQGQVKGDLLIQLLRSYWSDILQIQVIEDDLNLLLLLKKVIGLTDEVIIHQHEVSTSSNLDLHDPFFWILTIISFFILSYPSAVEDIFESAITQCDNQAAGVFLLLSFSLELYRRNEEMEDRIIERLKGYLGSSNRYPKTSLSSVWPSIRLESPFDDFISLNLLEIDDNVLLLADLLPDVDFASYSTSSISAYRLSVEKFKLLNILKSHPTDLSLWRMYHQL